MFKNQTAFNNQDEKNIQQQNLSQAADLKIEDIPIHTMAKDIQEIEHPTTKINIAQETSTKTLIDQNLTEKQKSSPFLSATPTPIQTPEQKPQAAPVSINAVYNKGDMQPDPRQSTQTPKNSNINSGKIFAGIVIVLIFLIIGAGFYYFYMTRQRNIEQVSIEPTPEPVPTPEPTVEPEPEPIITTKTEFSTDKPNYLPVDIENPDTATLIATINSYVKKVQESNITTPIEFLPVDLKNNPVTFETFAKRINLILSKTILADIGNEFSLFVYNDQSDMRLGVSIASKNDIKLKADMLKEEGTLISGVKPMFLPTDYTIEVKPFSSSTYNDAAIRYSNISSTNNLSVDYTIFKKQLLIGTTKMTLRSMIDHVSTSTASISAAKTTDSTPSTTSITADTTSTAINPNEPVDNLLNK